MSESLTKTIKKIGIPRLIIPLFFLFLCVCAIFLKLPFASLSSDTIRRFGMNGIMVLAMIPSIQSGLGPNFGLPLGIICGILGSVLAIEFGFGFIGSPGLLFLSAIIIALPFAIALGIAYGVMLNKIKGSEMLVATYTGFSIVSFMSITWILIPLKHPEMVWPIGKGLRVTIALDSTFGYVLNEFWEIKIGNFVFPTGLMLFFGAICLLMWLFNRSKMGIALKASGDNPKFALASGLNVDFYRIIGSVLSTVLAAIGIIVYAQSYGFIQLYQAPLMMAFPAVAAVLIGGASAQKAKISHVIIGTFLFQGLLTVALPVANEAIKVGNLSEVLRMIVQNGIILYALTKVGGDA